MSGAEPREDRLPLLGRHERQRLLEAQEPLGVSVGHVELADARPAQGGAVGVAQVGDQRAHIRARRALDHELALGPVAPDLLEPVDGDLSLRQLDLLAGAG